mmetsp:Transcript_81130/g.224531  ORF Transcript_81130/g.224531 Transcript_81130/m.224531 type:complete len:206 (-) Transcript_81130:120-737(-)
MLQRAAVAAAAGVVRRSAWHGSRAAGEEGVRGRAAWRQHQQQRSAVFSAAVPGGPIEALHKEVAARFLEVATGRPANVSAGQLVQLLFEVGAADRERTEAGEVLNRLMIHGFYRQTNEKRDSYGPPPVPVVGLEECKQWATLLFIERLKQQERAAVPAPRAGRAVAPAPVCRAVWCQCPIGASGRRTCALVRRSREFAQATTPHG